jgi:hypothetical protein
MTDDQTQAPDIPPALTEAEWSFKIVDRPSVRADANRGFRGHFLFPDGMVDANDVAALIALANAAMNDEDPRKFTRRQIKVLRQAAEFCSMSPSQSWLHEELHDIADAIESLLPPET